MDTADSLAQLQALAARIDQLAALAQRLTEENRSLRAAAGTTGRRTRAVAREERAGAFARGSDDHAIEIAGAAHVSKSQRAGHHPRPGSRVHGGRGARRTRQPGGGGEVARQQDARDPRQQQVGGASIASRCSPRSTSRTNCSRCAATPIGAIANWRRPWARCSAASTICSIRRRPDPHTRTPHVETACTNFETLRVHS